MEQITKKILIGGNWKCNGDIGFVNSFHSTVKSFDFDPTKADVMIFPPSIHIQKVRESYTNVIVGAQDVARNGNGAFTGEVSPQLLKDIGVTHTLIGHSERRQFFGDNEETISAKLKNAEANGMYVIMCIGENLSQREEGKTIEVVKSQLETVKNSITKWENIALAYEPVWAIGTGKTASPDQAEEVHAEIRKWLDENVSDKPVAASVRIIYGGSVNETNCDTLIKQPNIDGFLVGGASLKPAFKNIVESYKQK